MADWLDEVARKKKEESERLAASVDEHLQKFAAAKEAKDRMYESVKHQVEPLFSRLEALVEKANRNDFYLIAIRGEYEHKLQIFRYDAEQTGVDVSRGELKINKWMSRATGNERHLKGVASLTLYPESEGLTIWFTETDISMGWKSGKWYDEWLISGQAKLHECVGTVSYDNVTEDKILELVKWIATGKDPIPHFRNVIPYKAWEPPGHSPPRGCLYSPWTYIIPLGVILLIIFLTSRGNHNAPSNQSASQQGATVGTMREVRANQLNMRSGPGPTYPVVRVFTRNERIVSIGEPQSLDGELWIQASTPDGQVRGWVNRKFIYP